MIFNSVHFLFFFIFVTVLYFAISHEKRWFLLLVASCYFYMAFEPIYILILAFTIVIDYYAGILIENASGKKRKGLLVISLIANIAVLCIFKYYNFFNDNVSWLGECFGFSNPIPELSILLPIGLSFHTFQAMSYTIEVFRGNQPAERHFGIYSLYVMFYPQLVAGPIERPQNLLFQFRRKVDFDYNRVVSGLKLMVWGLFKKVVIADRLAIVADAVFQNPEQYNSFSLAIGVLFFTFQIFCDFSGYSDIAIGASRVMGIKLMKNFDGPYQSKSIKEFWSKWHISLSTWFKDYLYISLGGNRVSVPRWYLNLFIVFVISGFWHGANWTFIIWGGLHGCFLLFEAAFPNKKNKKISGAKSFLNWSRTFFLVSLAWVFFRAETVEKAWSIIYKGFSGIPKLFDTTISGTSPFEYLGVSQFDLALSFCLILFLEIIHFVQRKNDVQNWLARQPQLLRWSIYYSAILAILFLGVFESRQFIYFQF